MYVCSNCKTKTEAYASVFFVDGRGGISNFFMEDFLKLLAFIEDNMGELISLTSNDHAN